MSCLTKDDFDLLVVGGGITGAGIAREATNFGMKVALVESDDFASGTSSRSSKLIHGGLRYLAMGEVGLVRETALERKVVHAMAPHLAEPCWMVVPTKNRGELLKFRTAIGTYEKLGAVQDQDRHQNWDAEALKLMEPALRRNLYPYACAYREYLTDDARLVLGVLRSASGQGAMVASRVRATGFIHDENGQVCGLQAIDELTATAITINSKVIVNATGPWATGVTSLDCEQDPASLPRLHLSKGIHVVVPINRLPAKNLVILGTSDRRSIFVIPRGPVIYIGTTDTSYDPDSAPPNRTADPIRWPTITAQDVQYLLDPVTKYFDVPTINLDDVVAAWAGLRPLVAVAGKQAKEISRKDEIWEAQDGLLTIAGGKLTGFAKMAQSIVSRVRQRLPVSHSDATERLSVVLPGGDFDGDLLGLSRDLCRNHPHLNQATADRLVRLYGTEATIIASRATKFVTHRTQHSNQHQRSPRVLTSEIDWAVQVEGALTLEDVVYRRLRIAWFLPQERELALRPIADQMAKLCGWDESRIDEEIQQTISCFAAEAPL